MHNRLKNNIQNFTLIIISILISLILSEFLLRLYFFGRLSEPDYYNGSGLREPHETRGWTLVPDKVSLQSTLDYTVVERINSKGLRDIEHTYIPDKGRYRIVVLGDSFMEGYQVDLEKSFPRLLEKKLKDINADVVNMGVGGYGTTQELLTLKEEGLKYKPKLVIMAFFPSNDIVNNSEKLTRLLWVGSQSNIKIFGRPFAKKNNDNKIIITKPDYTRALKWTKEKRNKLRRDSEERTFLQRTVLYLFIELFVKQIQESNVRIPKYDPNILYGPFLADFNANKNGRSITKQEYRKIQDEAWNITKEMILQTRDLAKRNGAKFLLLVIPVKLQIDADFQNMIKRKFPYLKFELNKINKKISNFAKKNDIKYLDLLNTFKEKEKEKEKKLYFKFIDHVHWNENGHKVAANKVADYVYKNFILRSGKLTNEK